MHDPMVTLDQMQTRIAELEASRDRYREKCVALASRKFDAEMTSTDMDYLWAVLTEISLMDFASDEESG
ncbi:hypothetical protein IIB79_05220 [candidate division KSB1 bacterium]|nr:hypothetical protein [candidate division KSB1 bacterium]